MTSKEYILLLIYHGMLLNFKPPKPVMLTKLLVLSRTLRLNLKTAFRNQVFVSCSISCVFLLCLLCPLVLRLLIYFFPLLFSTALCFVVVYLLITSERREAREVFLAYGEKSGRGTFQVYDEVNSSGYNHHTEACCFLLKSNSEHPENGWEEDGEKAIFAGKLDVGMGSAGFFNEDATSCEVDRLAEGAWNCYFGRNSTWHYMGSVSKDSEMKEM